MNYVTMTICVCVFLCVAMFGVRVFFPQAQRGMQTTPFMCVRGTVYIRSRSVQEFYVMFVLAVATNVASSAMTTWATTQPLLDAASVRKVFLRTA